MRRMRWLSLTMLVPAVAVGAIACGPGPRSDAGAQTSASVSASASAPVPAPTASSAAVAPPVVPRPPAPPFVPANAPHIAPAAAAGCVLETSGKLPYDGGLPLRVDSASTPFLRITQGGGRLTWPARPGAPVATIVRDAFTVQGLAPANVKVHAARAVLLAGVLQATAGTTFTLAGSAKGSVVPTLVTPVFKPKQPLEARPCKDFGLTVPTIDPKAGLPTSKIVKKLYLRAGIVPVSATALGPPVLELSPALASTPVIVLEETTDRVRFVLEHAEGNVIGWAAQTDLLPEAGPPPDLGLGGLGLIGVGAGSGHGSLSLDAYECDEDVALYVDMTDASTEDLVRLPYARVGTIQKKHAFKVRGGQGGLDRVAGQRLEGVIFTGQGALSVAKEEVRKVCRRVRGKAK